MASLSAKQLSDASGGLAVGHIRSMDEVVGSSISRQNFDMLLLTIFAASALVLAIIGIYGVLSYTIAQRSREIGVRMALGAGRADLRNLVLGQGMRLAIDGVLIGVCAAGGLVRFIASFLCGLSAWVTMELLSLLYFVLTTDLLYL